MASPEARSSSLPRREADICQRLREIRELLKWKMPDFATELGITKDRLASYEYARAPIRFPLGRMVCERFNFNQRWFATGRSPSRHYIDVHEYFEKQIPARMLFSEAYEQFLSEHIERELECLAETFHCSVEELDPKIHRIGVTWPAGAPHDYGLYHARLLDLNLERWPVAVQKQIFRTLNAVLDEFVRSELSGKTSAMTPRLALEKALSGYDKHNLTSNTVVSTVAPAVKKEIRTWPELREELKTLTSQRGAKAALADACGVTPQAVSAWLREEYSPEADTVLWLLRWVENPQRSLTSTKNSGSVAPAPESKTQIKGKAVHVQSKTGRAKAGHKGKKKTSKQ